MPIIEIFINTNYHKLPMNFHKLKSIESLPDSTHATNNH